MNLTDEQFKKLDSFITESDAIAGFLLNQIKNKQISGELDKQRIIRFVDAYNSFRDSVD